MTNLQLQLRFTQRLRNHIVNTIDIRTIDIEYYLNEGLRRFVDTWYAEFESNEAARKRLDALVSTITLTIDSAGSYPNSAVFVLPSNCRYIVQERCTISLNDCHGDTTTKTGVTVKPIKLDYYNFHIDSPFKKPYNDLVWRMDIGSRQHTLIYGTDTTTINNYYIVYIKNPLVITLLTGTPDATSCEILPEYHEEILDKAIDVAIETFNLTNSFNTNKT